MTTWEAVRAFQSEHGLIVPEDQLEEFARSYRNFLELQRDLAGPITYTNRAARRARARAERMPS